MNKKTSCAVLYALERIKKQRSYYNEPVNTKKKSYINSIIVYNTAAKIRILHLHPVET